MPALDPDKTRGWTWQTYLVVSLVVGFFSIVAWPTLAKWLAARVDAPTAVAAPPVPPPAPPTAPSPRPVEPTPTPAHAPQPDAPPSARFRDVVIDEPFDSLFARRKSLMDVPRVLPFNLADGRTGVVCVVKVRLHADTAAGRVEAERVCQNRMAAALLEWKQGLETTAESDATGPDDRVSDRILTAMKGHVRTLPPVGRWVSAAGDVFYMAFGEVVPAAKF